MERRFGVSVYKEKFNFCSAHFLLFADGSREELHGHNYRVSVDVDGPIGEGDMVIDFMVLKPMVKEICDRIDHRTLIPSESPHLRIERKDGLIWVHHGEDRFAFPERDVIVLPLPNTSTERLAEHICGELRERILEKDPNAQLDRLRVSVEESSGQCGHYEERRTSD